MDRRILLCTVYRRSTGDYYDWFDSNTRVKFTFAIKRILSFGLRFIKQNIPGIEILECPTWEQYVAAIKKKKWDVVGFSFYLNEIHEIIKMVEYARNAGVKEIWGGNYGSLTNDIEGYFDKIFIGYAEEQIAKELNLEINEIIHPPLINYLGTTFLLKLQTYGVLFTGRGCNNGCDFCQTPVFSPRPYKLPLNSIENVLRYYKKNNINEVLILDENFGLFRNHTKDVVELLGKLGFYWYTMTRVNHLSKHLDDWINNGFGGALVGIETLNQQTLDSIGKKQTVQDCLDVIKKMHELNKMIIGYYMIGFEHDTKTSIKTDITKLAKLKLDVTQICVLTPLPRTKQWEYIENNYGIFDKDWHHYNTKHLVWNHPHIRPEDMKALLEWSFKKTYPLMRPLEMTLKFYQNYKEMEKNGALGGIKYLYKSQKNANKFNYFPKEIPLLPSNDTSEA